MVLVNGPLDSVAIRRLPVEAGQDSKLEVVVPFTDARGTLAAMRMAVDLAWGLDARINLVALRAVPYELELGKPPIDMAWLEEQLCI